jgi:hypothetical protein
VRRGKSFYFVADDDEKDAEGWRWREATEALTRCSSRYCCGSLCWSHPGKNSKQNRTECDEGEGRREKRTQREETRGGREEEKKEEVEYVLE